MADTTPTLLSKLGEIWPLVAGVFAWVIVQEKRTHSQAKRIERLEKDVQRGEDARRDDIRGLREELKDMGRRIDDVPGKVASIITAGRKP